MVIEVQAMPRLARKVVKCIRSVTDKPIRPLVLTHYHAVCVLGASALGAREVIMGASQLLYKQPDDVWRIDFQIGWDVDRKEEQKETNIRRRVAEMIGHEVAFEVVLSSIDTFQCRRMTRFQQGRVIFAGDAAHQVSPFGARRANSGVRDAENLAWKLKLVIDGAAPRALLDSYDVERIRAAAGNILNSTRATDFITPKSAISHVFRDAVLTLARDHDFARPFVNSGRLSVPCTYDGAPLNTADAQAGGPERTRPGAPCPDAPLPGGFLLERLGALRDGAIQVLATDAEVPEGPVFEGPVFEGPVPEGPVFGGPVFGGLTCGVLRLTAQGNDALRARYLGAAGGAVYLIRPDQHVAANWNGWNAVAVGAALARASGKEV